MAARPPAEEIIWMRPDRSRPAPRAALSREQIAAAALAVADAEGVDAVTMRRIARELGSGTMSLYRHVRTKDEVIDLIVDAALGEEDRPAGPSGDWRADLHRLAEAKRAVMLRHPWLARAAAGRPALGPNALASTEYALAALAGRGLAMEEAARVINTLNAFVTGFVQTEVEEAAWRRPPEEEGDGGGGDWRERTLPYLQQVLDSGRFPHFTRLVNEAEPYPDTGEAFAWQLRRVLDGLAAAVPE